MGNKHEVENLMRSTMENLRDMIDVNTVIGDVVETQDGNYIIPISRVSFGFASGGSEFGTPTDTIPPEIEGKYPFGGGAGAGVSVRPVAFLVVKDDIVKLLSLEHDNSIDRMVDSIPQILDMNKGFTNKNSKDNNSNT